MEPKKYCAFISYRHQSPDDSIAKALHTAIETYHVPSVIQKKTGKKRLGRVFRDQEELPLSSNLGEDIQEALDESEWLIAICSPRYLESRWCQRELEYFIEKKGRDRVLAVLVEGEPATSFPDLLRFKLDDEGNRTEVEPLAADLRGNRWKKKLKDEKLRLLAPMLSVTYDELKRRERQRTIRRAVFVSILALIAAAGLAVFLKINHDRAERLRLEAEEQARIAETERVRAEEQKARAEEERKRAEEEQARAEAEKAKAEEERKRAEEEQARAEAERAKAEEERKRAEEEKARAEEEERKKEQARKEAVFNDLGERLERASTALRQGEKRTAASILLESLSISEENEGMRRDELIACLRKTLYIEPLSIISSFNNQNVRVNDIVVSPDGAHAAGIVNSNSVAVIDLNANEILYQVSVGNTMINDLSFSPDGTRFLANCDLGRIATAWNTADGSVAFTYTSKADQPYHIANVLFWKDADEVLVQDMGRFYLVSADGTEKLFYTLGEQMPEYDQGNNLLSRIMGHSLEEMVTVNTEDFTGTTVLATADRSRVLVAGGRGDNAVIVLDDNGNRISLFGVPADPACFMPGLFTEKWSLSPDGHTAVCLSMWGLIGGWDTDSGELLILDALDASAGAKYSQIAFSADSERMAYTVDDQLYVALAQTGEPILQATIDDTSIVPSLAFTQDGKYLLMTNQSLFIVNAQTWALELVENADFGNQYNNVIPLEDSFLITRYDGTANFYSMSSLSSIRTVDSFSGKLCAPAPVDFPSVALQSQHRYTDAFMQSSGKVLDTAPKLIFSRDGCTAAQYYADGMIELFDTTGDGSVKAMIGELSGPIEALAMSERQLVAADQSTRLLFYDLKTWSVQRILNIGTMYSGFAFDPEGKLLMALCGGKTRIDVYSLESFEKLFSLHATADTFVDMAFSEDGAYAVGTTASGRCVVGDLWVDEEALLHQARRLIGENP